MMEPSPSIFPIENWPAACIPTDIHQPLFQHSRFDGTICIFRTFRWRGRWIHVVSVPAMFRVKVRRFGSISYHFLVFSHDDMVKENSWYINCIFAEVYIYIFRMIALKWQVVWPLVMQWPNWIKLLQSKIHCAAYNVMFQYVCNIRICLIHTLRGNWPLRPLSSPTKNAVPGLACIFGTLATTLSLAVDWSKTFRKHLA